MTDGVGQREDYREHRLIGPELCTEREEKISDIYGEFLYLYEGKRTGSRRGARFPPRPACRLRRLAGFRLVCGHTPGLRAASATWRIMAITAHPSTVCQLTEALYVSPGDLMGD